MNKKYFGTDGIRGKVGSGVINPDFILKLGWAVGRVFPVLIIQVRPQRSL